MWKWGNTYSLESIPRFQEFFEVEWSMLRVEIGQIDGNLGNQVEAKALGSGS